MKNRTRTMHEIERKPLSLENLQHHGSEQSQHNHSTGKILIVDDDFDQREILSMTLPSFGYTCREARDGQEGYDLATRESFDLVICDYQMPKMDGLQFIRLIRATPALEDLPIVFLTGFIDGTIINRALQAGATSAFGKPYHLKDLVSHLKFILEKS